MTNPIWKNLFVVRIKHSVVDDDDHHHHHHHYNYIMREDRELHHHRHHHHNTQEHDEGSGPGPAGSVGVSEASGGQPVQGGAHQPSEELLASWRKSLEQVIIIAIIINIIIAIIIINMLIKMKAIPLQSLLTGFPFPMDQQRPTVASPLSTR